MFNCRIGDSWAALTVTDIYIEQITTSHNGITDHIPTRFLEFRCECGKTKTVAASTFPGRRKMRDCGCSSSTVGTGKVTAAYIDLRTHIKLTQFAKEQGLTVSKAVVALIQGRLEQLQTVATSKKDRVA